MLNYAPIVLFCYNRLWHLKQTINALTKNCLASESELFIYSDGFKDNVIDEIRVNEVREYIKTISGFKNVFIVESKENLGLSKSVIKGVTELLDKNEKVIVMEDDLVTSTFFLSYMTDGLNI